VRSCDVRCLGERKLFDHKALQHLVDIKWHIYGRRRYMRELLPYILFIIFFIAGFVANPPHGGLALRFEALACHLQ
jgi:hypothetical protein